jgi:glycosyltransferase involved in cell wall biosynthesis
VTGQGVEPMIGLSADADSVYFLMSPGWNDELRTNRWHYASRWARHLPVVLVQPSRTTLRSAHIQPETRIPGCEILDIGGAVPRPGYLHRSFGQSGQVMEHMRQRQHTRPILWIYNPRLAGVYAAVPAVARVFHATENYFDFDWVPDFFFTQLEATLALSDLVVAVSQGVAASLAPHLRPERLAVVTNGCDGRQYSVDGPTDTELAAVGNGFERIAIYAGTVNNRLDFGLLDRAAETSPDTLIAIYGPVVNLGPGDAAIWRRVLRRANVESFGPTDPERLPALYRTADVGIIPYKTVPLIVRNGFPLKALEMSATGLPIVASRMEPLVGLAAAIVIAEDEASFLDAFATANRESLTQSDRDELASVCRRNDYDVKFADVLRRLQSIDEGEPHTRIDVLVERLGLDAAEPTRARHPRNGLDALSALAAKVYGNLGERLPPRFRQGIPKAMRDRVRRRFSV